MFNMFSFLFKKKFNFMDYMPPVRGKIITNFPLSKLTWLGVGGPADILFEPEDKEDLMFFVEAKKNLPVTIIGGCSNLLVRDGGIPGVVVKLGKSFSNIELLEDNKIHCGCGAKNMELAQFAYEHNLSGFEFLSGIPGTLGGALRMNAGAFNSSISERVIQMEGIEPNNGQKITLTREEIPFDYRFNALPVGWIFTDAILSGIPEDKEKIKDKMNEFKEKRKAAQPQGVRTAGSVFKNPIGLQAWKLIEKAGCRGMRVGDAQVSEKHANFFINTGKATAMDFETLIQTVQNKVYETCNILLEPEVRCIGVKTKKFSSFGGAR